MNERVSGSFFNRWEQSVSTKMSPVSDWRSDVSRPGEI